MVFKLNTITEASTHRAEMLVLTVSSFSLFREAHCSRPSSTFRFEFS